VFDAGVRLEQIRVVYEALPMSLLAIVFNGGILAYLYDTVVGRETVLWWYGTVLLVSFLRLGTYFRFRSLYPELQQLKLWERMALAGALLSGLTWGLASFLLFPENSLAYQVFLSFVVAGMTAGAVTTLSTQLPAALGFILLTTVPLLYRFAQSGHEFSLPMTVMLMMFIIAMVLAALGYYRNFTETLTQSFRRRLTEEKLSRSETKFRRLFEFAPLGIGVSDIEGRITDANQKFFDLLGYPEKQLLNMSWADFTHPEDRKLSRIHFQKLIKGEIQAYQVEKRYTHRDGKTVYVQNSVTGVFDEQGSLEYAIGMVEDITDRKKSEQALRDSQMRLESLAYYDTLTELPNRRLFADHIQQEMAVAERRDTLLAVCYLDLDGFKPINDRLGHEAGDRLLVSVAERLRSALRKEDTIARWGGDEFALLLNNLSSAEECADMLDRLLSHLEKPHLLDGEPCVVTASVGVTLFPEDLHDADTLLRHADHAMYLAKEQGRNGYHLFDSEEDRRVHVYREKLKCVQEAIDNDELILHFQPKVRMNTGSVQGVEALVRWQHPEQGLLPPGDFLPLLRGHDLLVELDWWVVRTALRQMTLWQRQGLSLQVSINVSAKFLQQDHFIEQMKTLISANPQIAPGLIELEIIETEAIEDLNAVSETINRCVALGISFALDDFGTGYSSLTYFRHLSAGVLKIDQSFVRNMLDDNDDLNIVKGVIGLAQAFQRDVVAEGVETEAHGQVLLRLGCQVAQGFGIARPMSAEDLPDWIAGYSPPVAWMHEKAGKAAGSTF
jgi:diguanylate cyclase (GGDEF)-like protein/PAS domain S-box-containing protein